MLRSPLGNLDGVPPRPGLVGVVAVLFGSTAFDSFKDSNEWLRFTQSVSRQLDRGSNFVALLVFCAVVGVTFAAATMATGVQRRVSPAVRCRTGSRTRWCRSSSATSWRTTSATSSRSASRRWSSCQRPAGQGLRTCSAPPTGRSNYWLSTHPTFLAVLKVLSVVTGHVLGVIAAHDRAIKLLPQRHQLTGQLPLLFVMVFYTVTGLYLLFGA